MVFYCIVHLFGNAPICASTVLECSCCRIHRSVAAPNIQSVLYGIQGVTRRCRLSWLTKSVLWVGKGISFRKNSIVERAVQTAMRIESPNFETFKDPGHRFHSRTRNGSTYSPHHRQPCAILVCCNPGRCFHAVIKPLPSRRCKHSQVGSVFAWLMIQSYGEWTAVLKGTVSRDD